ncbi:putative peptidoglycan binding domain-containing protein [Sulfurisphaera javensis]|uniref:putative peptidoglycan binding domain-containing protein n=1 Tax=Sulfurisphaera javensis TaxID=2049879 RepID=UPI0034E88387
MRVDDHKEPLKELERILNLWIATFVEEEMVNVKDYEDIISSALAKLGYKSLKEWIEINNFEGKYTGDRIGKSVLNVLISQAESLK